MHAAQDHSAPRRLGKSHDDHHLRHGQRQEARGGHGHITERSPSVPTIGNQALDLPELQGEPDEIAREKGKLAAEAARGPIMCEDTLLCFNALNGLPGPFHKMVPAEIGPRRVKQFAGGLRGQSAYAQCLFALCARAWPGPCGSLTGGRRVRSCGAGRRSIWVGSRLRARTKVEAALTRKYRRTRRTRSRAPW